jgi:hypothetical protein
LLYGATPDKAIDRKERRLEALCIGGSFLNDLNKFARDKMSESLPLFVKKILYDNIIY